ncbi:MAG: translocation/assembly module TamB domain-containing protein [Acidobacteriota bacterium]
MNQNGGQDGGESGRQPRPRRGFKRAVSFAGWLALALALVVLLILALLQIDPVRRQLVGSLENMVSVQTGWRLRVDSVSGGMWPLRVHLGDVSLEDEQGQWLAISDAVLTVQPWPRSGGLFDLTAVLSQVRMDRIPTAPPPPAQPSPPGHPLDFLDALSPVPVDFSASIRVDGLALGEPVAGRALAMNILADVRNAYKILSLAARTQSLDGPSTGVVLSAAVDQPARTASLDIMFSEAAGGMVSELAGLGSDSSLSVNIKGAGPFEDWSARIAAARADVNFLEGTVTASLGPSSKDDARFGLDLALRPGALLQGQGEQAGQLRAALGETTRLGFKGVVTSAGLIVPKWKLLVDELAVNAAAGKASLRGDLGVDALAPRLSFTASLLEPALVGLDTGPLEFRGEVQADIDPDGPFSANADIETPSLAGILKPTQVRLEGLARLKAALKGDLAKKDLSIALDGGIFEIRSGSGDNWENLADALGREITLLAQARLEGGTDVTVSQSRVESKAFSADASGSYGLESAGIELDLDLKVADLTPVGGLAGQSVSGNLNAVTRIRGNTSAPVISAKLEGNSVTIEATRFDTVGAQLETELRADGSSEGRMWASASRGNAGLDLNTRFALAGERLQISELRLAGPGLTASGNLDVGLGTSTASGQVQAGLDLGKVGAFLNVAMSGTASLRSVLTASGPRQDAAVNLEASGVKGFGLSVVKAEVSGSGTDLVRAPQGRLLATVSGARMNAVSLETLNLQALGSGKEVSFSLKTKGTLPEPFEARTAGVFAPAPGGGSLRLGELQARAYDTTLALVRPASLTFGSGNFSLSGLSLTLGSGRITASGEMKPNAVTMAADVQDFPLELLGKARLVDDVSGKGKATLRVSGAPQNPRVDATLELSQVRYAGFAHTSGTFQVAAQAEYSQGRAVSNCRITMGEGATLEANAALPVRVSLRPAAITLSRDASLEASLKGTADLSVFAAFMAQEDLAMRGVLKADLTARGRLSAPDVSGLIGIENGVVEYAASGTVLRNMVLRVEASGSRITIHDFSASDAGSGRVSAQGQMVFPPGGGFSLDMDVVLDKAALLRTDTATAEISGRLAVSGDSSGVLIKGKLSTGQVDVAIPEKIAPDVTPVDVVLVSSHGGRVSKERPKAAAAPAPASGTGLPIRLDIGIDFPGRIFVRGYGLDSVWNGTLHVGGTASSPTVSGDINVVRGRIEFFGKQFTLVRGIVSFTGGPPTAPRLDIDAQNQSSDITADILVTGSAAQPKVSFSSVPALPQDEILARVLFGKSTSGLTAPQAIQLAQAAAALTGRGDALDLLGKTRKLVGLDYLGMGPSKGSDTGQMSVTAGKYISEKVYIETSQGFGGQGPNVSVQVDVYPNVTLDSTIGMDSKTGVGLNWKMDY